MLKFIHSKKSFTLLEIIIVIIIIGVLTSLALPRLFSMIRKARAVEAVAMLQTIHKAVQRCFLRNNIDFNHPPISGEDVCYSWDTLDIDNPFDSPGSHFTWEGFALLNLGNQGAWYSFRAKDKDQSYYSSIVFVHSTVNFGMINYSSPAAV